MHPWRSGWSKAMAIACGLLAPGSTWAAGPATIPGSTWGGAPATFDVAYTAAALAEGGFLQVGPSLRQQMKRLELTAVHGADFLGTTKADCHYTREEDTNSGAYRDVGWCTWRDHDGDQIFESWEGTAADAAATLFGTGRLTGGTGKFTGITGTLSWSYGDSGRQIGQYQLPQR